MNSTPELPILCLSDHEHVSTWTSAEPELVKDYGDVRERKFENGWQADYIVDACLDTNGIVNLFLASKSCVCLNKRDVLSAKTGDRGGIMRLQGLEDATSSDLLQGGHAAEEMIRCVAIPHNVCFIFWFLS